MVHSMERTAVVSGANRGIGLEISRQLARHGVHVVLTSRNVVAGQAARAELEREGLRVDYHPLDVAGERSVGAFAAWLRAERGGLDILVNNAGDTGRGDLEHIAVERWDTILAVNLRAPFILLQESIAPMRARGGGSIVNIGSILAYVGEPKLGAYSVSKGGLMTLTKNAASLLNRDRIRVNQINVGWTLTEGERRVKREQEGKGDEWIAEAIATRPFGRLLTPMDIAYAAAYFASSESECVTGSVLDLEQYPPGALANS
jgi:NAD(P)-dependent dehydrogenase (short-subunit alcohol dehydrogenase family)